MSASLLQYLQDAGNVSTSSRTLDAADLQVNTAATGSAGTDAATINDAWGKAIPELIGHTRTVCLPIWTGNPQATIAGNGDEHDTIDFAVLVGYPGPRSHDVSLLRIWFDNVPVYDNNDPSVTTLTGEQLKFTFYDGKQKVADASILSVNGKATPAFTGRMYLVFRGITTRDITATTTVTQFSKLPEVQVEIQQQALIVSQGGTYTPFVGVPAGTQFSRDIAVNIQLNHLSMLTDYSVDTYDYDAMQYLGTALLREPWGTKYGKLSIHAMIGTGVLVVIDSFYYNRGHCVVWDIITGIKLYEDTPLDSNNQPAPVYVLLDCGNGYLLSNFNDCALLFWDGGKINNLGIVCTPGDIDRADFVQNFTTIANFGAQQFVYFTAGRKLWRIVITAGGLPTDAAFVGKITFDGSNRPLFHGTKGEMVFDLSDELPQTDIIGLFVDDVDPRFVYLLTQTPSNNVNLLRRIANFYYYNPQDGSPPPADPFPPYGTFGFHLEVANAVMPSNINGKSALVRDKRYPLVASSAGLAGEDLVIMNLRTLSYNVFPSGDLFDGDGAQISGAFQWAIPAFLLPRTTEILCFDEAGIPAPGKIKPRATSSSGERYTIGQLFIDNSLLAGYDISQIEVDNLDDALTGQQLNQTVNFKDLMAQLCAAFRVDMTETAFGGLKYNRQVDNRVPDLLIDPGSLIPISSSDPSNTVDIDRVASNEIPSILQLSFINEDYGFQIGSAVARRTVYPYRTANAASSLALSLPIVMKYEDGTYYAGLALFDMWAGKTTFTINLPPRFLAIEPGDVVQVTRPSGRNDLCKVTEVQILPDFSLTVTLSSVNKLKPTPYYQNALNPTQVAPPVGAAGLSYGTLSTPSPLGVYVTVIDNIALTDADLSEPNIPLYVASTSPSDISTKYGPNDPQLLGTTTAFQRFGTVITALYNTATPFHTDYDTQLVLKMSTGAALASCSDADFRAGVNNVCIGSPGRWELIFFRDVVLNADGTYTLSTLLRGRRNSDAAIGTGQAGDVAVVDVLGAARYTLPAADLNQVIAIYGMQPGVPPAPRGGVYGTLGVAAAALAPLPPRWPRARRQGNGDVALTWHRRDRAASADFWSDPPVSDPPETYHLSITGAIGVRDVAVNAANYTYSLADQTTDGLSAAKRLNVVLYQQGSRVAQGLSFNGGVNVE